MPFAVIRSLDDAAVLAAATKTAPLGDEVIYRDDAEVIYAPETGGAWVQAWVYVDTVNDPIAL